jgi:hypothetical protein
MNVIHENFIGIYEGLFSPEYCKKAINYFEDMRSSKFLYNRQQAENVSKLQKEDEAIYAHTEELISLAYTQDLQIEFNQTFWDVAYKDYASVYPVLDQGDRHASYAYKIQKTVPGGGYHLWHYESGTRLACTRLLTWILYLNDVEEGGETEFLYLPKRIKPKAGTLILWPAGFTHTHRGNPPLNNPKYIVTGWTEF